MKTLERRARMSELQRFRKAQVSDLKLIPGPFFYNFTWWSNEYAHNYLLLLLLLYNIVTYVISKICFYHL